MRVILSGALFTSREVRTSDLAALIGAAVRGRHVVEVESEPALKDWLAARDAAMRCSLQEDLGRAERLAGDELPGGFTVRVDVTRVDQWEPPDLRLALEDAIRLLSEPLGLLVENNPNDLHFLLRLFPDNLRTLLAEGVEDGWVAPLHGGGGTIHDQMKLRAERRRQRVRTFVMFDSDRLHREELSEDWLNTLPGSACAGDAGCGAYEWEQTARRLYPKQYHRLSRRYIESYLPLHQLESWCTRDEDHDRRPVNDRVARQRAFEVFKTLSDDQRWFFNMKGGLQGDHGGKNAAKGRARQRGLYDDVNDAQRAHLQNGFGRLGVWYDREINPAAFSWDPDAIAEGAIIAALLLQMM